MKVFCQILSKQNDIKQIVILQYSTNKIYGGCNIKNQAS